MGEYFIELTVNGERIKCAVKPYETLLQLLRNRLRVTDPKAGCEKGDCGSCTVIMDGMPIKSCIALAVQADGRVVQTLKGVQKEELVKRLQDSFVSHGAVQCGFCTPGMILTAKCYLEKNPVPSREEIRRAISGNLCRCTGYKKILDAIEAVAKEAAC